MLQLDCVVAGYGPTTVLNELSFELHAQERLAMVGRNGVRKTTAMRAVMGLVDRAVQPQQSAQPVAGGMYAEPPPQQMAAPAPGYAQPMQEQPVLVQPWGQRNAPAQGATPVQQAPQQRAPQGPPVDDAFVF